MSSLHSLLLQMVLAIGVASPWTLSAELGHAPAGYKDYTGYQLLRAFPKSTYEHSLLGNVTQLSTPASSEPTSPTTRAMMSTDASRTGPVSITRMTRDPSSPVDMYVAPEARPAVLDYLRKAGIEHRVQLDDVGQLIAKEAILNKMRSATMRARARSDFPSPRRSGGGNEVGEGEVEPFDFNSYHSHEEIVAYMTAMAEEHEDFVEVGSMGRSYEGREMVYLKIGYPQEGGGEWLGGF